MKKKVNSINNNYFLGGFIQDQFSDMKNNLGNSIMNTVSGVSNTVSGLLSSGNAKTDAITSGIASGLQTVGSAFGPIGSAAGAIAGALTKGVGAMIGSKGSVNTDTGEMTKGRGILGSINRDELEAQYRRVNQGISDQKQTALMQQEWAQEHGDNDFSLAAEGGIIPTTLAYLDDGELGRTPDGQLFEIPEEGKPTDSNLVKVPVGTQILSDKIKVPGTNKTFAQKGKEIMKSNKYKGKDKYAENSKKLNDWNNQAAYNELLTLQESIKNKKQSKRIKKYQKGTDYIQSISRTIPNFSDLAYDKIMSEPISENKKKNWFNSAKTIANKAIANTNDNNINGFDLMDTIGDLAGLTGPIANIASATPEKAKVFTYTPQFTSTDYDITPMLREIDLSNAITRYNINKAGGAGIGANLAQAIQGQVARDRAISQAYNQKLNIENERKARNTNIYNDWARYDNQASYRGYVEDSQNRAAADQIRRTGIRDLSTALQTMSKDRRLTKRDQATLAAMEPFLQYGMTKEQYQKLISLLS